MTVVAQIARLTLVESLRRRIATAALVVGAVFLAVFGVGLHFVYRDIQTHVQAHGPNPMVQAGALSFLVVAGLYAGNMLSMMASVVVALDTLAGEIGSGVIETLCTRPVRRFSILLGKWLGCVVLVVGYVVFLLGGVVVIAHLVSGSETPRLAVGLGLVVLEGVLLMTLSLAAGTRLSPLASGMAVFGLYGLAFIGGWIEQIGTLLGNATARSVGIVASLIMPSESLWQLASYQMQPPLIRDLPVSPFSVSSVPSPAMVVWAGAFVVVALMSAGRLFASRDL
jgi:Cu-processing system permease protein